MTENAGPEEITAETLESRRAQEFPFDQSNHLGLRLRRGVSWLQRAEQERDDEDAAFIFLWIAFNSLYAQDSLDTLNESEREVMRAYFNKVVPLDADRAIYDAIWDQFTGPIRVFMDNQYVFQPFWTSLDRSANDADWVRPFQRSKDAARRALAEGDTVEILWQLFGRLYVLRNQLLHGGATWGSILNRDQVRDGKRIMEFLTPHFIRLMMDNPSVDWGVARYPPVDGYNRSATKFD